MGVFCGGVEKVVSRVFGKFTDCVFRVKLGIPKLYEGLIVPGVSKTAIFGCNLFKPHSKGYYTQVKRRVKVCFGWIFKRQSETPKGNFRGYVLPVIVKMRKIER